jgi:hypothetical protein
VVLLPHLPGAAELIRRDMHQEIIAGIDFAQQRSNVALGTRDWPRPVEAADEFAEDEVRGDVFPTGPAKLLVLGLGGGVELVALHGQRQPGPGVHEGHGRLSP